MTVTTRIKANINPEILAWARQTAGYGVEEASRKIGVTPAKLTAWETGDEKPTLRQLRLAAKVYKRPSALFFGSTAPSEPPTLPDFRLLPDTELKYTPSLLYEIRRAYQRRAVALELSAQLGEAPPEFPLKVDMSESPEDIASRVRDALGIALPVQLSWRDHYTALRSWISAVERLGVLVFHVGDVNVSHMRGFSISDRPFPVIAINAKDSPRGRIFTLLHELVHIALHRGGICNVIESEFGTEDSIEVYCNRVAGEALVPGDALLAEQTVIENAGNPIWQEEQLRYLANRFMVSQEVILRRLLTLGRTTTSFYNYMRNEYGQIYERQRPASGWIPHHRRILRDNGTTFTSLVLSAYYNGIINSVELCNYLGGIKLRHVRRIEQALQGGEGASASVLH